MSERVTQNQVTSKCRTCGARIFWAVTAAGKRMPLDAEPRDDGEWTFSAEMVLLHATAQGQPRYVSHFATCPHADQHRRPAIR